MSHSLHPHAGAGYQRPSSRSGSQQYQRDRDRQLLEEAVSLYLSFAQPSFHHRGAAGLPAAPYYEDLDFPLDYGEDYTLLERPSSRQRTNKKVLQDYSSLSGLDGECQSVGVCSRWGPERGSGCLLFSNLPIRIFAWICIVGGTPLRNG